MLVCVMHLQSKKAKPQEVTLEIAGTFIAIFGSKPSIMKQNRTYLYNTIQALRN